MQEYKFDAFRDGHAHPLFAGREALGPRLDGLGSLEEILAEVRRYADQSDNYWIVGGAYDRSLFQTFEAAWLDSVVPDRPVVLHASDHHTIWVNSKALSLAGISEGIPHVATGYADLGPDGRPSGLLRESGAMDLVLKIVPPLTREQELSALDWAQEQLLQNGIAQAQDAWIEPGMAEIYIDAASQGRLKVAFNLGFRITPENYQSDFEYFQGLRSKIRELDHPLLRAGTAKFFTDGVLGSGTASVHEPYLTGGFGELVWEQSELLEATNRYAQADYQLHIHAIGDQGVTNALDAIAQAPSTTLPPVIAHAELIHPKDLGRFRELGVYANFQPLWAKPDPMLMGCQPRIGNERLETMYQIGTLLKLGANVSFGSDWPVTSVSPLQGIQTAVTREHENEVLAPKERITPAQAMSCYSTAVSSQLGWHHNETVILDSDPNAVSPNEIGSIKVLAVLRGDEVLFG